MKIDSQTAAEKALAAFHQGEGKRYVSSTIKGVYLHCSPDRGTWQQRFKRNGQQHWRDIGDVRQIPFQQLEAVLALQGIESQALAAVAFQECYLLYVAAAAPLWSDSYRKKNQEVCAQLIRPFFFDASLGQMMNAELINERLAMAASCASRDNCIKARKLVFAALDLVSLATGAVFPHRDQCKLPDGPYQKPVTPLNPVALDYLRQMPPWFADLVHLGLLSGERVYVLRRWTVDSAETWQAQHPQSSARHHLAFLINNARHRKAVHLFQSPTNGTKSLPKATVENAFYRWSRHTGQKLTAFNLLDAWRLSGLSPEALA